MPAPAAMTRPDAGPICIYYSAFTTRIRGFRE